MIEVESFLRKFISILEDYWLILLGEFHEPASRIFPANSRNQNATVMEATRDEVKESLVIV